MVLSDHNFQSNLKQIVFKTCSRNRAETLGYDDLFANRRVVIFSITNIYTSSSSDHIKKFNAAYDDFILAGIDNVYAINFTEGVFAPWVAQRTSNIKGLTDTDMLFVDQLRQYYGSKKTTLNLAMLWQFILIINNGVLEIIWHNPFKENTPLEILKNVTYRYRKLTVDVVLDYLKTPAGIANKL